jgi:hypothetical protein
MRGLTREAPDQQKERERDRKPPESRGYGSYIRPSNEPRAERQGDIAKEKRGKGERMGMGFGAGQNLFVTWS